MKMPEHSCTSCTPLMYSPFAQKSFCYDRLRQTHKYVSGARCRSHKHTDGTVSINSTADVGGKDKVNTQCNALYISNSAALILEVNLE